MTLTPLPILNIAAYRFVPLDDLPALRDHLQALAQTHGVRGTVLLAPEGINLSLAGPEGALRAWLAALHAMPAFAGLVVKESFSAKLPFKRLKVKVKREIIRMDLPTLRPATARAPAVAPLTLARWLGQGHDDAGRPVRLLDTRNDFEVDAGAFDGAIDWRLAKFTEFPAALATHRGALQDLLQSATLVSYCTGGIRCEKAALVMQDLGLDHCLQLDGGILAYFEATGGQAPGWHGSCVVFDDRAALDPALNPTPRTVAAAPEALTSPATAA